MGKFFPVLWALAASTRHTVGEEAVTPVSQETILKIINVLIVTITGTEDLVQRLADSTMASERVDGKTEVSSSESEVPVAPHLGSTEASTGK